MAIRKSHKLWIVWAFDFSDGEVHHVAINIYAKEVALIIDGVSRGLYDMEMAAPLPSAVWIGSADGNTGGFKGAIAALRIWGVPVDPKTIDEYRYKDVLSEAQGNHPDIDYLQVVSDFEDSDILVVEAEETVEAEDKK